MRVTGQHYKIEIQTYGNSFQKSIYWFTEKRKNYKLTKCKNQGSTKIYESFTKTNGKNPDWVKLDN